MALQYSGGVRDAKLDAVESTVGTTPTLAFFTGSPPATCATANSGSLIATITLPSDWMAAASGGSKAKSGTWSNTSIGGSGTIGYFRIYASGGTCHIQGTCANSGADMNLDNNVVNAG
jgi:hypothetical protein